MQYIAPAHYAALTAEFEARGKLLQLKAHTEVLALLRAVAGERADSLTAPG